MDYEFSSKEELFQRVKPALNAKIQEIHRLGYQYISDLDIWNYLIEERWKSGKDIMLSDIVNDIMNVEVKRIDDFLKEKALKNRKTQYFDKNLEIL